MGSQSAILTITGGIFEFVFSDAFQQMTGAFIYELSGNSSNHPFINVTPLETMWSYELFTTALGSHKTGKKFCGKCGTKLSGNEKHCPKCGKKV